jgi:large repetitive protein
VHLTKSHTAKTHPAKAHRALATDALFRACKGYKTGKVSDRFFIVEDVALDVGQNNLLVIATDWVGNARSQKLIVSRVNVGSNRITLAGGNRQRGALNTELAKPLIVTAIDRAGLPLANIPLTFEVLRGTGSINPAATSSTTTTTPATGSGSGTVTVTTTIPNALTGSNQPATQPNGVNPARRLLITTDANGRAAVWFTLGRQSGEAGNMVQVSASDTNSKNATLTDPLNEPISEAVVFTATGEKGLPSRLAAEGNGSQYAETGGQPLDALTAVAYDGEGNAIPGAVVAYVIEGNNEAAESASFGTASNNPNPNGNANNTTVSSNGRVFITTTDNNGRSAARPTMGSIPGTVKIAAYAFAPNTAITAALIDNVQSDNVASQAIANFQIGVLQQSDGPTQYTGRVFDRRGQALAGVRVSIGRTNLVASTDSSGYFLFRQDELNRPGFRGGCLV